MKLFKSLLVLLSVAVLAACGSSGGNDRETKLELSVTHLSPDAPAVNVYVDGGLALPNVDYKQSSGAIERDAGAINIEVRGILPDESETGAVIGPVDLDWAAGTRYNVLAVDSLATIEALVVSAPQVSASELGDNVRLQIVHAAPAAPAVDVYATAPGADLMVSVPVNMETFEFKDVLGPIEVPAGTYQIRVTLAGTTTVVYDSGDLPLAAGADLMVAAVANTVANEAGSLINLLAISADGASEILDADMGADIRVVHVSADAPPVDVVVNDGFVAPLIENLAFTEFQPADGYVNVPAAIYDIKVVATGDTTDVLAGALAATDLTNGLKASVLAVNPLATIAPQLVLDTPRSIATEAQIRVIHGAAAFGAVDIYVTAGGTGLTGTPAVPAFAYQQDTDYISLLPGSYDITVTAEGSTTPELGGSITVILEPGGIYTAIAHDSVGAVTPLGGLILLDDF